MFFDDAGEAPEILAPPLAAWLEQPGRRAVVTRRTPVGATRERVFWLDALDPDGALALLRDRLGQRFDELAEDLPAVVDAVDRLPLLLDLAAARLRFLDPGDLLDLLAEDREGTLAHPLRRGRHASWSAALRAESA